MPRDDRPVTTFPEQDAYQKQIDEAKKRQVPVGGAPKPTMPRFDQPVAETPGARGMLTKEQMEQMRQRGELIPGVGSGYAFNQPAAAKKEEPAPATPPEGFANPPRPEGTGLRQSTVEQLEKLAKVQAADPATKEPAQDGKESDKEPELDFDEFAERVTNFLNNKKRREAIEARCPALDLEDLLEHQELRQRVPIIPGKFEPTYRTMSGSEDLFVKRSMLGSRGPDQFILDRFAFMNLVASLFAINGKPLPTHLTDGEPDDDLFKEKMRVVGKYPSAVVADMSVNFSWFDARVKKLLVVDEVKGF